MREIRGHKNPGNERIAQRSLPTSPCEARPIRGPEYWCITTNQRPDNEPPSRCRSLFICQVQIFQFSSGSVNNELGGSGLQ